jgi:hypothetical protein
MGVFYRAGEFIGGISKELVDKIGSATLTTTAKDLSGAVNELNSKIYFEVINGELCQVYDNETQGGN